MNTKRSIAALICAIMCLAMLPAQAEDAQDMQAAGATVHPGAPEPTAVEGVSVYKFPEHGITLPVYDAWYTGTAAEGASSEMAQLMELDEAGAAEIFSDENGNSALLMIAVTDNGAGIEFIAQAGVEGADARDDSFDWEAIAEDFASAEYHPGHTVYEWGSTRTPYANVIKLCMTADDGSISQVHYIFLFEDVSYMLRYFETDGEPIAEEIIVAMDYLVLNLAIE